MANFSTINEYFAEGGVLGRPPMYSTLTDPNKRVTTKTIAYHAPLIHIVPGRPDASSLKNNKEVEEKLLKFAVEDDLKDGEGGVIDRSSHAEDLYRILASNATDNRYWRFEPEPYAYLQAVNSLSSRVFSRMDLLGEAIWNPSGFNLRKWGGINLWANKASAISENASNEYVQSVLENITTVASDSMRQAFEVLGAAKSKIFESKFVATGGKEQIDTAYKESLERAKETAGESHGGGFFSTMASLIGGNKLMLPKIWKSSEFAKSYSLNFKFISAYGDKRSVYIDVLLPLLALLPLVLPKQSHRMGYEEPFPIRLDAAGWFTIESGVITSMTIKKAPDDNEWTKDGLPRAIEVDMEGDGHVPGHHDVLQPSKHERELRTVQLFGQPGRRAVHQGRQGLHHLHGRAGNGSKPHCEAWGGCGRSGGGLAAQAIQGVQLERLDRQVQQLRRTTMLIQYQIKQTGMTETVGGPPSGYYAEFSFPNGKVQRSPVMHTREEAEKEAKRMTGMPTAT